MSRSYISPALRRLVRERAGNCCEYCLINEDYNFLPFEIDHIISEKHNGETTAENLCWSCSTCNGYKGSDVASYDPVMGQLTRLYNPRMESWHTHFSLHDVEIVPQTPIGRVTTFILPFNSKERLQDRTGLLQLNVYPCESSIGF